MAATNVTPSVANETTDIQDFALDNVIIVLYTLTIVLILTLNPLSLITLRRVASFQLTTKIFLASLTVNDLVVGLCVVPILLIRYIHGTWPLGAMLCIIYKTVNNWTIPLSMYSLLLLTIDRYLAIVWCLHYPRLMTVRISKIIVVLGWLTSLLISSLNSVWTYTTSNTCDFTDGVMEYIVANIATVGCICIFVLYMHMLVIARHQARRIAQENQPNAPQRISTKSLTTVFIIFTALIIGWGPAAIRVIAVNLFGFDLSLQVRMLFYLPFYTNNWLNVAIYYWRNSEFRHELCRVVSVGIDKLKNCTKCGNIN